MHRFEKWREAIRFAPNEESLNTLLGDYLRTIAVQEIQAMPAACQQVLMDPHSDIQAKAVTLLQEELRFCGGSDSASLLHEIAHTYAVASIRLGQIQGRESIV